MLLSNSQISRLHYQLETLNQIINGLRTERIDARINPGKWSIKENIAHLARYQVESIHRVSLILNYEMPLLQRYVAEKDELFPVACSKPLADLLVKLQDDRKHYNRLSITMDEDKFKRTGIHPVLGSMTLSEWVEFFLLHEAHHLMIIFKLAHPQF